MGFGFKAGSKVSQETGVRTFSIQLISDKTELQSESAPAKPQKKSVEPRSDNKASVSPPEPVILSQKAAKRTISQPTKPVEPAENVDSQDIPGITKAEAEDNPPELTENNAPSIAAADRVAAMQVWLSELQQRINHFRHYPRQAAKRGLEGDIRIEALINIDGSLAQAKILSGHRAFHHNSLRSLKLALPFPPPDGTKQPVTVVFTIHYRLE